MKNNKDRKAYLKPDEVDEDEMKLLCIELLIAIPLVIDAILRSLELKKMMG